MAWNNSWKLIMPQQHSKRMLRPMEIETEPLVFFSKALDTDAGYDDDSLDLEGG